MLEALDLAEPDLNGLKLLLDHEGIGLDRPVAASPSEEIVQPVEHDRQTSVPPTVMPSSRMVGSPTPTGTD